MRGLPWLLALVGVAQYGIIAYLQPADYVGVDMAYLVMALFILTAATLWTLNCSWGWCGDCDCDHCEGCSAGNCCGECRCYSDKEAGGHSHEHSHDGPGHTH